LRPDAAEKVARLFAMLGAINADLWLCVRVSLHCGAVPHKPLLSAARCYSEDLDYVRSTADGIVPVLGRPT
jgi:hypothetical protein